MRRLIYTSLSLIGSGPDQLYVIVDQSRARNGMAEITGMLWWDGGRFAQVLEGPPDEVSRTMQRIRSDKRHTDIQIVFDQTVTGRLFGRWEMTLSDTSLEGTARTAFLAGLAATGSTPPSKRLLDIMLSCDD